MPKYRLREYVRIPTFLYNMTYNELDKTGILYERTAVFEHLVNDRLDTTLRRLIESGRFVMSNYNIITKFTTLA